MTFRPSIQPFVSPIRKPVSDAEAVLHTLALTKTYRMGEVDVHPLRGVEMALHEGEFMLLLGVTGSGKSTLNILGGLDRADEWPSVLSWGASSRRPSPHYPKPSH